MFVRTLEGLQATGMIKLLVNNTTRSARFLTAVDGMGFSYNDNRVDKGSNATLWYRHHWEANYIASGRGELTDLTSGERWILEPGVLYVVGPNDRHRFRVTEDEHHVSVFCPPLRGDERHNQDGAYEASGPGPKTDRRMFVKRADEMRAAGKEMVVANGRARTIRMLTQAAYNVGPRDRHRLGATTDLHLLSIFSPALKGDEQHDEEGALPPSGPTPPGIVVG